jgi:transcriptional regulator with XRE-family HTH domain
MIAQKMTPSHHANDNMWFNATLLKSLRKDLTWTQQELAVRAGLSVRVIAKAESGSPISQITLEKLVNCLREAGKVVTRQDFAVDNLAQVRKYLRNYAEYGANAVAHSRSLFASNLVVHLDCGALSNPLAGCYHGLDEFDLLHRKFCSVFIRGSGTLGDLAQMRLIGQEVLAWGHEFLHVPNVPLGPPCFMMLRFVLQGGEISRLDWFYDAGGLMSRIPPQVGELPPEKDE